MESLKLHIDNDGIFLENRQGFYGYFSWRLFINTPDQARDYIVDDIRCFLTVDRAQALDVYDTIIDTYNNYSGDSDES